MFTDPERPEAAGGRDQERSHSAVDAGVPAQTESRDEPRRRAPRGGPRRCSKRRPAIARRSSSATKPRSTMNGDPRKGREVFDRVCAKCHKLNGAGPRRRSGSRDDPQPFRATDSPGHHHAEQIHRARVRIVRRGDQIRAASSKACSDRKRRLRSRSGTRTASRISSAARTLPECMSLISRQCRKTSISRSASIRWPICLGF